AGRMVAVKEIGVGMTVAVLLDVTVVRGLLLPALMTLLGEWNWWAPGPLRRLHSRVRGTRTGGSAVAVVFSRVTGGVAPSQDELSYRSLYPAPPSLQRFPRLEATRVTAH